MFTGIIEETGTIRSIEKGTRSIRLTVHAGIVLEDVRTGDSISTNGVCLTVSAFGKDHFTADVMPETMRRSGFSMLKPGSRVNLERSVRLSDRLGGHLVSGHIDGTGRVLAMRKEENAVWYTIQAEPGILRYIVEKGSVALDGISLTVASAEHDRFSVSVIPHTQEITTLPDKKPGDILNIECDIVAKYIEKFLGDRTGGSRIDKEFLARHDFI
jgi:riboflavin synthase